MRTNFAIRIKSKDDYDSVIQNMINLNYGEDKHWNLRMLDKHHENLFLTAESGDNELTLYSKGNLLEETIYDSYEEFKNAYDENN